MEWIQILLFILLIIIMNVVRNAAQRKKRPKPEEQKHAHEEAVRYTRQEVPVEVKPPAPKPKISTVRRAEQTWGFKPSLETRKFNISLGVPLTAQKKKVPARKNSLRHMIQSLPSKRSLFALNEVLNPPYLPKDRL